MRDGLSPVSHAAGLVHVMTAGLPSAVGAVTLYDMVKGVERGVEIGPVRLLRKSGGKSGEWQR